MSEKYVLHEKLEEFKNFQSEAPTIFDYLMKELGYVRQSPSERTKGPCKICHRSECKGDCLQNIYAPKEVERAIPSERLEVLDRKELNHFLQGMELETTEGQAFSLGFAISECTQQVADMICAKFGSSIRPSVSEEEILNILNDEHFHPVNRQLSKAIAEKLR